MPHNDNPINPDAWYFRAADYAIPAVLVVAVVVLAIFYPF